MGYELTDEELENVFVRFKDLADKKKNITGRDIEALVLHRRGVVRRFSGAHAAAGLSARHAV